MQMMIEIVTDGEENRANGVVGDGCRGPKLTKHF